MSEDPTFRMPVVTMIGNKEAHVDNFRNIISYDCEGLSVTTGCGVVHIEGQNLEILYYDQDEIAVKGRISTVVFK